MGKFEKLVVLAVLFAAAVVLAFSLNRGGDKVAASDPLSGAEELLEEGAPFQGSPVSTDPSGPAWSRDSSEALHGSEPAPSLLLNAGNEASGVPSKPTAESAGTLSLEPKSDPSHSILLDSNGLRPSFLDEFMLYTVAEGDTWSALAQRFYRDGRYTRNLHLANEDLVELTAGKEILVPVYDFIAVDAGLRPGEASAAVEPRALAQPSAILADTTAPKPVGATPGAVPQVSGKPSEYEVRPGDTLSDISLAAFGTATRWEEILEANKDLLTKPESLKVGMKLRIPAGGKVPTAGKPEAKKTAPAPKTVADKSPAPAKKKKVL